MVHRGPFQQAVGEQNPAPNFSPPSMPTTFLIFHFNQSRLHADQIIRVDLHSTDQVSAGETSNSMNFELSVGRLAILYAPFLYQLTSTKLSPRFAWLASK